MHTQSLMQCCHIGSHLVQVFSLAVRGEVRNLFDALYTMSGEGDEFFPAAERNYILGISLQL